MDVAQTAFDELRLGRLQGADTLMLHIAGGYCYLWMKITTDGQYIPPMENRIIHGAYSHFTVSYQPSHETNSIDSSYFP